MNQTDPEEAGVSHKPLTSDSDECSVMDLIPPRNAIARNCQGLDNQHAKNWAASVAHFGHIPRVLQTVDIYLAPSRCSWLRVR